MDTMDDTTHRRPAPRYRRRVLTGVLALPVMAACTPTVKVEAPSEPIEINLNIRIEQEVRVKIDRELDSLFESEDDIF